MKTTSDLIVEVKTLKALARRLSRIVKLLDRVERNNLLPRGEWGPEREFTEELRDALVAWRKKP